MSKIPVFAELQGQGFFAARKKYRKNIVNYTSVWYNVFRHINLNNQNCRYSIIGVLCPFVHLSMNLAKMQIPNDGCTV